jgi:hypothetical protein
VRPLRAVFKGGIGKNFDPRQILYLGARLFWGANVSYRLETLFKK